MATNFYFHVLNLKLTNIALSSCYEEDDFKPVKQNSFCEFKALLIVNGL